MKVQKIEIAEDETKNRNMKDYMNCPFLILRNSKLEIEKTYTGSKHVRLG